MIALLGLPPKEMLQNSEYAREFFDDDGKVPHSSICSIFLFFAAFCVADSENQVIGEVSLKSPLYLWRN
jgi:hypothetical protein